MNLTELTEHREALSDIKNVAEHNPRLAAHLLQEMLKNYELDREIKSELIILNSFLSNYTSEEFVQEWKDRVFRLIKKIEGNLPRHEREESDKFVVRPEARQPLSNKVVAECRNIFKNYGSAFQLSDISLQIREGEVTGVVGENGNGKSTLLKIIAGELREDSGTLSYSFSNSRYGTRRWDVLKNFISYLPQDLKKIEGTVRTALKLEAAVNGITGSENTLEVDYWIYRLGLDRFEKATWHQLSGGYKLRFSLAKALLAKPKLVVLDEPLANLDVKVQPVILRDLRDLANSVTSPIAVVISSLHIDEIESVSDNVILLKEGDMIYSSKTAAAFKKYNIYELRCHLDFGSAKKALLEFGVLKIKSDGFNIVVFTKPEDHPRQFLRHLAERDIVLSYFADITNSTKAIVKGYVESTE